MEEFKAELLAAISKEQWSKVEKLFDDSAFAQHFGIKTDLTDPDNPACKLDRLMAFHLGGVLGDNVNGPTIAAMFDFVIGLTSLKYFESGSAATTNINIRFIKPVTGPKVRATASRVTSVGNRLFSEARLTDGNEEICAVATGEVVVNHIQRDGW